MTIKLAVDNDLPEELKSQLSKQFLNGDANNVEFKAQITECLTESGDITIDEILVYFYRTHGKIYKRNALGTRLHRLCKEGHLKVIGRGVYGLKAA